MTFFSRPDLSNIQFKQLPNSELTLSGQTQIATISGLTLTDGTGGYIPIIATDTTNNFVLTYDGAEQVIKLKEATGSGSTGVYSYTAETTCAVGGLPTGQTLYNDALGDIIHCMITPTKYPELTNPSVSSFTISPSTLLYEVGCSFNASLSTHFNKGCIDPQYCGAPEFRSGDANTYNYMISGTTDSVSYTGTGHTYNVPIIIDSNNTVNKLYVSVSYDAGGQPYNSSGGTTDEDGIIMSGLTSGTTSGTSISRIFLTGIYPYFWGTETGSTAPVAGQALIDSGTKGTGTTSGNILPSTSSIIVNFEANNEYIWLAIPTGTTKTRWTGSNSSANTEAIPSGLFDTPTEETVNSPSGSPNVWSTQGYEFYISNYKTETYAGGESYRITFSNT